MDEFKTSVLPVVANGRLLGMMKDTAALDNSNPAATVETLMDQVEIPYVRDRQHLYDVLKLMAELGLSVVPVLEMARNDYSLQQIARIVEDEGARVLSLYCSDMTDSMRMEVTLKVNREDVRAIIQAFERFQYTVHTAFLGSKAEDDLRDRYEDVMRIIKM